MIVLLGVLMFTGVVVSLVGVLLVCKARLVSSGEVTIHVNDDPSNDMNVPAGTTLLNTLAERKIFIPSACGGKGSCGVCKVKVVEGGGSILPTEVSHINRKQARQGVRLSCQIKVKGDMRIEIPPEIFSVRQWTCGVRSNRSVATFITELILELPAGEEVPFRAGGYIQIKAPPCTVHFRDFQIDPRFRPEWDRYKLWDLSATISEPIERAYSMANYPLEKGIIMLNVRIATPPPKAPPGTPPGLMSSYIYNLKPGDEVVISGPFGEFFARGTDAEMMFIGGGAGMAPMRSHIFDQFRRIKTKQKVTFWYGARSLKELFYKDDFDRIAAEHPNFAWHVALSEPLPEDNWNGPTGLIHRVVHENYLKNHPAPEDIEYYMCGPPLMNSSCTDMLLSLGVERENIMFDDFGL
ncbi:MAG TPA: NADH:ubiquinone reductase (Na(+)-transporting) subunit F [Phycisphaerae bacterium]|nr:NADH:ubiquinone reductase (Na(+)-transporting) subunit F [Phycisphaerae bacterium]